MNIHTLGRLRLSRWPCFRLSFPAVAFLLLIAAPDAFSQGLSSPESITGRQARWAVLDFTSLSPRGTKDSSTQNPDIRPFERYVTDSVVVELSQTNRYDVYSRQETNDALKALNLSAPLSIISERRLGRQLDADAVVTGIVETTKLPARSRSRAPRFQVMLSIEVRDPRTGELVNGARVIGVSEPHDAPLQGSPLDKTALEEEAATNAAFAAVAQLSEFALPKASVLILEDPRTVLLNHGSQEGLTVGLKMVVTRFGERIGVVRVIRVKGDQAEAAVVERGAGIASEDVATAIYTLPSVPAKP